MVRLGVHTGKGEEGIEFCKKIKAETIQIFTHNPHTWRIDIPDIKTGKDFQEKVKRYNIYPVISHCGYLLNLGTTDNKVFYGSVSSLKKEIELCHIFGCKYFVLHVGKHKEAGIDVGIKQVIKGLNECKDILNKCKDVEILLESVAGQGSEIGARFSILNKVITGVDKEIQNKIGVCLDTCHIFVAGYDITSKEGRETTFKEIEESFGFEKVKCIHVNDAKGELGSHLDRHENIGNGKIGYEGLKAFLTDKRIAKKDMPLILETPEYADYSHEDDLKLLRKIFSK